MLYVARRLNSVTAVRRLLARRLNTVTTVSQVLESATDELCHNSCTTVLITFQLHSQAVANLLVRQVKHKAHVFTGCS